MSTSWKARVHAASKYGDCVSLRCAYTTGVLREDRPTQGVCSRAVAGAGWRSNTASFVHACVRACASVHVGAVSGCMFELAIFKS
eukprot:1158076-Pelagomonas_calceolata.AAC.5